MGTMQDELKKVIDNWDKPETTTATTQEKTVETKTQSARIVEFIAANPGLEGLQLTTLLPKAHPDIKEGNMASFLKQLCNSHHLKRIDTDKVNSVGRPIYQYYATDEAERKEAVLKDKKRQAMVDRAAIARAAKAKLDAQRKAQNYKEELKALRKPHPHAPTHTFPPTPEPQIDTGWTVGKALNNLSVLQARQVYDELKKIFGA